MSTPFSPEPPAQNTGDVTRLLRRWKDDPNQSLDALIPAVYDHLKRIADAYIRRERPSHTLQATGLVNELFIRLLDEKRAEWNDRVHFYSFAARMMRRILIDYARMAHSEKRGGARVKIPLAPDLAWIDAQGPEMMDLDAALSELEALDASKSRAVEYRYFLGCTSEETAELLGVSKSTIDRDLRFVRSWLIARLKPTL